jgi:hypothetical protein
MMSVNILTLLSIKGYVYSAWYAVPIFITATLIMLVIFGWLESKLKIAEYENIKFNMVNPDIQEIKKLLLEIKKRL